MCYFDDIKIRKHLITLNPWKVQAITINDIALRICFRQSSIIEKSIDSNSSLILRTSVGQYINVSRKEQVYKIYALTCHHEPSMSSIEREPFSMQWGDPSEVFYNPSQEDSERYFGWSERSQNPRRQLINCMLNIVFISFVFIYSLSVATLLSGWWYQASGHLLDDLMNRF